MTLACLAGMLSGAIIFRIVTNYRREQCLFVVSVVKSYVDCIYLMTAPIHDMAFDAESTSAAILSPAIALVLTLITFPLILLFFRRSLRPALDYTEHLNFWKTIWLLPIISNVLYTLVIFPRFAHRKNTSDVLLLLIPLLWTAYNILFHFLILKAVMDSDRNVRLSQNLTMSEKVLSAQKNQLGMLHQQIAETARLRHDFRHTLLGMQTYLEAKDYDKLDAYIKNYLSDLDHLSNTVYCRNSVINTILTHYVNLAQHENAKTEVDVALEADAPLSDIDMSIILGNVLENAVNALSHQNDGEKFLHVRLHSFHHEFVIIVENSYSGEVRRKAGVYLSSKEERRTGIGISSVQQVVEKYDGTSKFEYANQVFTVSILLHANASVD